MSVAWALIAPDDDDGDDRVDEVGPGTPGAVPTRRVVDRFGRVILSGWIVPADGAADQWDARLPGDTPG